MIIFYRILFPFLLLAGLPYYGLRMIKRGGYSRDWHHRFGQIGPLPAKRAGVKRVWVQAVSVGEIRALQPIMEDLIARSDIEVVLTTTTSTGYLLVQEHYTEKCLKTGIFPLDWAPFCAQTWDRIEPDISLLMEGDLWPEHLHQAKKRNVPALLINGRMSNRSFGRYQKISRLSHWLFGKISHVYAASNRDAQRFAELGIPKDRLLTTGNVKFDVRVEPILGSAERQNLRREMGFDDASLVIMGSSTWPGEEAFLLKVLADAKKQNLDARLILTPRHAERRKEIRKELEKHPVEFAFRTKQPRSDRPLDVYVGDTTGELAMLTQAADVVFVGKSLPPHNEGQTPIEAAALGMPIVYGPGMANFHQVCQSLESAHAAWRALDEADARKKLIQLLTDHQARNSLAQAAHSWHAQNRGAADRILQSMTEHFLSPE
ncbi:MAG: glycosyltransferase N-terminal domain-containing protein [Verrucomicrobiota bacterium]